MIKDDLLDQLLQTKKKAEDKDASFNVTLLRDRQLVVVSAYVQLIWTLTGNEKAHTPREFIDNTINTIRDIEQHRNKFWITKSAAMIRELTDYRFDTSAKSCLKCLPNRGTGDQSIDELYIRMQCLIKIINSIGHDKYADAIKEINSSNMFDSNVEEINGEVFDKLVYLYIESLYKLFQCCNRQKNK